MQTEIEAKEEKERVRMLCVVCARRRWSKRERGREKESGRETDRERTSHERVVGWEVDDDQG